jgi:oxygen-independent coproporphyrinogen-3 oxidase
VIEALYCHVPFCHTICPFCAFAVHGNRPALHAPYLEALLAEVALRAQRQRAIRPIRALYLGGGTPSTLSLEALERLLAGIRAHYPLAADAEIACEVNPEDAAPDYLAGLRGLGVNRVSLGLQSLDDATLRALGRNNDAARGWRAVAALQAHGPANFNLDLLFGAPGVGPGAFRADVTAAVGLEAPHLSLYGLDIEPGTRFARNPAVRDWAASHRDEQAGSYAWAARFLRAQGYRHYEVSNFCRPGREGLQNLIVWDGGGYLGFGPGAHSFAAGRRWHNERHLRAWLGRLQAGEAPTAAEERLTPVQQANEALMLALRRDSGLDIPGWEARHGTRWDARRQALAERLAAEGRATLAQGRLVLTPAGFLLADEITAALAVP